MKLKTKIRVNVYERTNENKRKNERKRIKTNGWMDENSPNEKMKQFLVLFTSAESGLEGHCPHCRRHRT